MIWNIEKRVGKIQTKLSSGHSDWISCLKYSPNGRYLASGSMDNTVIIWKITNNGAQQWKKLSKHTNWVSGLSFSQSNANNSNNNNYSYSNNNNNNSNENSEEEKGLLLISASYDNTVICWNVDTGAVVYTLKEHTQPVTSCAFITDSNNNSTSSKFVITTSQDGSLRVFDTSNQSLIAQFVCSSPCVTLDYCAITSKIAFADLIGQLYLLELIK